MPKQPHHSHALATEKRQLDLEYLQMREVICNADFYRRTSRHSRIRFDLWGRKLDQLINDISWKKNRNNYIKLMYLMAESEVIVQPFLSLPPEGQLPSLKSYEINAIIDLVEQQINDKIKRFGFCSECLNEENERGMHFHLQRTEANCSMEMGEEGEEQYCEGTRREEVNKENKIGDYNTKTTQVEESIVSYKSIEMKGKENKGTQRRVKKEGEPLRQISLNRQRHTMQECLPIPQPQDTQQGVSAHPIANSRYFCWKSPQ